MQRKAPMEVSDPSVVLVPITSDKGLCGGVNSSIVRQCKKIILGSNNRSKYTIFAIGTPYNYPTVMSMAVHVQAMSNDSDKIVVIYNEFKNLFHMNKDKWNLCQEEDSLNQCNSQNCITRLFL